MCWGGKVRSTSSAEVRLGADKEQVVSLSSGSGTPFSAVAEVHPALVDPSDAEKVTVPMCMLASKDEKPEDVKKFKEALKVDNHVETFDDQVHVCTPSGSLKGIY